jgi:hypothetical protein
VADPEGPIIVPVLATTAGATLKWHLENGSALKRLQGGGWNYVVLQEQSLLGGRIVDGQAVVGDPKAFFKSTREWVRRIRQVGATPILYMTWAHRSPSPAEMVKLQKQLAVDSTLMVPLVDLSEATASHLQEIAWAVVSSRSPQRNRRRSEGASRKSHHDARQS